jgi:hypothetical protein
LKTNVCTYIGPDNEPTAKIDDLNRPQSLVPATHPIVNVWRDPETDELHVSVHAEERVLLSIECDWWESTTETRYEQEVDIILHPDGEDAFAEESV